MRSESEDRRGSGDAAALGDLCRRPAERARKREELLSVTEGALATVARLVGRGRLRSAEAISLRAGRVIDARKMAKHFELDIADGAFGYRRRDPPDDGPFYLRYEMVWMAVPKLAS